MIVKPILVTIVASRTAHRVVRSGCRSWSATCWRRAGAREFIHNPSTGRAATPAISTPAETGGSVRCRGTVEHKLPRRRPANRRHAPARLHGAASERGPEARGVDAARRRDRTHRTSRIAGATGPASNRSSNSCTIKFGDCRAYGRTRRWRCRRSIRTSGLRMRRSL